MPAKGRKKWCRGRCVLGVCFFPHRVRERIRKHAVCRRDYADIFLRLDSLPNHPDGASELTDEGMQNITTSLQQQTIHVQSSLTLRPSPFVHIPFLTLQ